MSQLRLLKDIYLQELHLNIFNSCILIIIFCLKGGYHAIKVFFY